MAASPGAWGVSVSGSGWTANNSRIASSCPRAPQRVAVAGHFQQRIDVAPHQQQSDDGADHVGRRQGAAQAAVQPHGRRDQQRGEHGLDRPHVQHRRQRGQEDQPRRRLPLPVHRLLQEAHAAAFAIEGAQHRLRLRKLHHALAGAGVAFMERAVRAPRQPSGQEQHAGQQRQRRQRDQPQLPVQGEQGADDDEGRHQAADHRREHMRGQLGHGHRALRDDMGQARRVLRREPAYRQAGHMVAQAVARGLQHRGTDAHACLFDPAAPGPAGDHAGQQHGQPARAAQVAGQQPREQRRQRGDGQAAEQPMGHGHPGVAAEDGASSPSSCRKVFSMRIPGDARTLRSRPWPRGARSGPVAPAVAHACRVRR